MSSSYFKDKIPKHLSDSQDRESDYVCPIKAREGYVEILGQEVPIYDKVEDGYFDLPPFYRMPCEGDLRRVLHELTISLACRRHVYIHGPSGSGKDAFLHAYSNLTKTPSKIFQITPDTDVQSWLFSLRINKDGTYVNEGELLKALRDGYVLSDGEVIPYMVVISDFDRATSDQAEHLRLVLDSIKGRIVGLNGETYEVLPGTQIVVTANTSGSGDARGRFVSANSLDLSLLDRFERFYQFTWMCWDDEVFVLERKFPHFFESFPDMKYSLGNAVRNLRSAIHKGELDVVFGHRALCRWLGHCEDILQLFPDLKEDPDVIRRGAQAYMGGMPDDLTRSKIVAYFDAYIPGGLKYEGDIRHIDQDRLIL